MDQQLFFNIYTFTSSTIGIFYWSLKGYHHSSISSLINYQLFCLILFTFISYSMYFQENVHLKQHLLSFCVDFLTSLPAFFLLIHLTSIKFLRFTDSAIHSLVLAILCCYPIGQCLNGFLFSRNHRFDQLDGKIVKLTKEDRLYLFNVIIVGFTSWLLSMLYATNDRTELAIYPSASCLGAMIGSAISNLVQMIYYLFDNYNQFLVY